VSSAARGARWWRSAAPVIFAIAGLLFAVSAVVAHGQDLRPGSRTDLPDLIGAEQRRLAATGREITSLRGEVDSRTTELARGDTELLALRRNAEPLARRVGLDDVEGPAVSVTLDDAPRPRGRALPEGVGVDDVVVHQQDVQATVNALWSGGAEAMQLMDQRVISTSAVRCVGNTLLLQGRVYSPPYIITAIGNRSGMLTALDQSPQMKIYRQYVDYLGLGYQVRGSPSLRIAGYTGSVNMKYAQESQQ
jgi:uncharacterized protein YlxW (UPF0749 family)